MIKKAVSLLCLIALACALLPALGEEPAAAESYYAYFTDARWMRSEPRANTANVIYVPERTLLRLTPVNEKYAAAEYNGKTGYIFFNGAIAVEYADPFAPGAEWIEGFFGAPVYMRSSPLKNARSMGLLPADVRFRIAPVTPEYAYIAFDGASGYVYLQDFVEMQYARGALGPFVAYSADVVPAYDTPCYGAVVKQQIAPYTPVTVNGYDGDHLVIAYQGEELYVENGEVTALTDDFAVDAFDAVIAKAADLYEYPLENAQTIATLKKNAAVTVYAFHGEYALVQSGDTRGYLHYSQLKSNKNTQAALKALEKQVERIESQRFLNVAFTMMEEGNPIVAAYNKNCGGTVIAKYKYGVPYLFAGMNASSLLKPRHASQNSNYYSTEKIYLGGFDCIGFARWLHNECGMKKLPAISDMKTVTPGRINMKGLKYDQWQDKLKVGDCVAVHYKGGYHIMVYVGTLASLGITAQDAGEALAPYLDNPIVIHCGMNNYHTAWYTQYIREKGYSSVTPPDGGVTLSILGVPYEKVPYTETMWEGTKNVKTFYWFDLMGYNLTVSNPDSSANLWYVVYRNTEK